MSEKKVRLKIRLIDGSQLEANWPSHMKLINVARYVKKKGRDKGLDKKALRGNLFKEDRGFEFFLSTAVPKVDYDVETEEKTLGELFGRGASLVIKDKNEISKVRKGSGTIMDAKMDLLLEDVGVLKMSEEDHKKKEEYRKKKREMEALARKEEHDKKKIILEKVLLDIEEDKLNRIGKVWITKEECENKLERKPNTTSPGNVPRNNFNEPM